MQVCKICGESFVLLPTHRGKSIHCPECAIETTTRYQACVSWDGKSHGSIQITKDVEFAQAFNRAQRRNGYGVGGSLVERKTPQKLPTQSKLQQTSRSGFVGAKPTTSAAEGLSEYYKRH